MTVFEKVDLAIKALQNAEEKTSFAPPASREELARLNALLAEAKLPELPVDFMYLLSRCGSCEGRYFNIYGTQGLQGAAKPDDVLMIDYSIDINREEDDDDPKGLYLGDIPGLMPYGIHYKLVYKNGLYYHLEDDRGVLSYFNGPDNIGDFIMKEIKTAEAGRRRAEVEKHEKES
ncbi:MAG TPA: hypothetical protein PLX33_11215 [Alphaproteobacteria bacterium]|nr:hypothetical protein [Alphaproteobacteria bacterium]